MHSISTALIVLAAATVQISAFATLNVDNW